MANSLKHLFSPIRVKKMEIPNRIVMPPMGTNLGNPDGTVSEANLAYMKRRARGGAVRGRPQVYRLQPGLHRAFDIGGGEYPQRPAWARPPGPYLRRPVVLTFP